MIERHMDPQYSRWRDSVLERDGYRCRFHGCTNKKRRSLQVHHIQRWADAPLLRYNIDNGITLCKLHHRLVFGNEEAYASFFTNIVRQTTNLRDWLGGYL